MIIWIYEHLKSLPPLQWWVILAIGIIPVLIFPNLPSWKTVGPFDLPKHPVYVVWVIAVLFLVQAAFRQDRSNVEQAVDSKLGPAAPSDSWSTTAPQ